MLTRLPIRFKLALLVGGCGLVLVSLLIPLEANRAEGSAERALDEALREEMAEAVGVVAGGENPAVLGESHAGSSTRFVYQLLDGEGRIEASSQEGFSSPLVRANGTSLSESSDIVSATEGVTGTPMRALALALTLDGSVKTLVVGADTGVVADNRTDALWRTTVIGLAAALAMAVGVFLVTGLVLRPVERIRRSALDVSNGVEGAAIVIPPADDELRRLALAFDRTVREFERHLAERDRFIAEASHELRTPITKLRTELDLALRRPRTVDELRQSLVEASRHTARLVRLVEQLLDLTRLQAAAHTELRPVAVDEVIAELLEFYPDVSWIPTGMWVDGDPVMIDRAVRNLLDNALTHGEPPVAVTATCTRDAVVIEVSDSGPGLDDDLTQAAGQPFRRSTTARAAVGSGLGLAIVAEIAAQHHGHISFRNSGETNMACLELRATAPPPPYTRGTPR